MRRIFTLLLLVLVPALSSAVAQVSAPGAYDPPVPSKSLLEALLHPLPQQTVREYLGHTGPAHHYRVFEGQNSQLEAQAQDYGSKRHAAGTHFQLETGSNELFTGVEVDGNYTVYLGAVASEDAEAIRLRADLSRLGENDEVYVIEPGTPRAHGPFTAADAGGDGSRWLATVSGDTAVIAVRTLDAKVPELHLLEAAHFFVHPEEILAGAKVLPCNNHIACDPDPEIEVRGSAVGRYVFVTGTTTFICSGSLINNPDTIENEPYFLSANHCVETQAEAQSVEVFWDFRKAECDEGSVPPLSNSPRSYGDALLATNSTYDVTLFRLGQVPSGTYGRFYLGWTTATPTNGQDVLAIHHPDGAAMRISYGDVTQVSQDSSGYQDQIRAAWSDGVTEFGSSGCPMLTNNTLFQIIGVLSNGPTHQCPDNPATNWDRFGAFRLFFPEIEGYLKGDDPPNGGTNPPPPSQCPAEIALKEHPELLEQLRNFRDNGLMEVPFGDEVVRQYYEAAPAMAQWVSESATVRTGFTVLVLPFAQVGAWLGE